MPMCCAQIHNRFLFASKNITMAEIAEFGPKKMLFFFPFLIANLIWSFQSQLSTNVKNCLYYMKKYNFLFNLFRYRIVASNNTCYYSEKVMVFNFMPNFCRPHAMSIHKIYIFGQKSLESTIFKIP